MLTSSLFLMETSCHAESCCITRGKWQETEVRLYPTTSGEQSTLSKDPKETWSCQQMWWSLEENPTPGEISNGCSSNGHMLSHVKDTDKTGFLPLQNYEITNVCCSKAVGGVGVESNLLHSNREPNMLLLFLHSPLTYLSPYFCPLCYLPPLTCYLFYILIVQSTVTKI